MNLLNPIVMTSAKEKVVSELRKAILSKRMVEGESLTLENIASQLNVSITPVREAFQILDRDGLIKLRKNKGAVVLADDIIASEAKGFVKEWNINGEDVTLGVEKK